MEIAFYELVSFELEKRHLQVVLWLYNLLDRGLLHGQYLCWWDDVIKKPAITFLKVKCIPEGFISKICDLNSLFAIITERDVIDFESKLNSRDTIKSLLIHYINTRFNWSKEEIERINVNEENERKIINS